MFTYQGTGTVAAPITDSDVGQISFQGTYWLAKFCQTVQGQTAPKDSKVQVIGREGVTLLVRLP